MDELKGVLAFLSTANAGNFTAAAKAMGVSPQAVASAIARLESHLGVRLCNRTTRALSLTEEGQVFLERVSPALSLFKSAIDSTLDLDAAPSGLLKVTSGASIARKYVIPQLGEFRKRFPNVSVELALNDHAVDLVREGYDVAIRGGNSTDSSLITRRVCSLSSVCVASPRYLSVRGVPRSPAELDGHDIVLLKFAGMAAAPWHFRVKGKIYPFEPKRVALSLSDTDLAGVATVEGLGVARMPLHFAWPYLQSGRLKLVLPKFLDPGERQLVIHYAHRSYVSPRIRVFVEFMLHALRSDSSLSATVTGAERYFA